MDVRETLKEARRIFVTALSVGETERGIALISDLPADISDENKEYARAYAYKLSLKRLALNFAEKFDESSLQKLLGYIDRCMPKLRTEFPSTHAAFARMKSAAEKLERAEQETRRAAEMLAAAKKGAFGSAELSAECDRLRGEIAALGSSDIPDEPLGAGVAFPDLKAEAESALGRLAGALGDEAAKLLAADDEKLLRGAVRELDAKAYDYCPDMAEMTRGMAGAIVLCTPFDDEAELYVRSVAEREGRKFSVADLSALSDASPEVVKRLLDAFVRAGKDCLLLGAAHYVGDSNALLVAAMRFGKAGRRIYMTDDSGGGVYRTALELAVETDGLSTLDVSRLDLSMPAFADVIRIFEERGMISPSDSAEVRNAMKFIGFVGLNEAVAAFVGGKDWKLAARRRSEDNRAEALEYLARLANPSLFIDSDWGDFSGYGSGADESKPPFDYDRIAVVNPENVRRIMQSGLSLFSRIGILTRYCLLAGADESVWEQLDPEIREERITEATKLTMRALAIPFEPVVEIKKTLGPGVAGQCCDGGKLIQYVYHDTLKFDFLQRMICHECFHAFQSEAINGGWKIWHWAELGVTRNRIGQWKMNQTVYVGDTSSLVYKVEIYECDARAFEHDCADGDGKDYRKVDLV